MAVQEGEEEGRAEEKVRTGGAGEISVGGGEVCGRTRGSRGEIRLGSRKESHKFFDFYMNMRAGYAAAASLPPKLLRDFHRRWECAR